MNRLILAAAVLASAYLIPSTAQAQIGGKMQFYYQDIQPSYCAVGRDVWINTSAGIPNTARVSMCVLADTYVTIGYTLGTTPPATCKTGEIFFDTDATAGQNLLGCTATNTWTAQAGGGGGGTVSGTTNRLGLFTGATVVGNANVQQNGSTGAVEFLKGFSVPYTVLTPSATPVFDFSVSNIIYMQMTANVTSSTVSNCVAGKVATIILQQDFPTGNRTMSWPVEFLTPADPDLEPGSITIQSLYCNGANALPFGYSTIAGSSGADLFKGKTSGQAYFGVEDAAGTPQRVNIPTTTPSAIGAVLKVSSISGSKTSTVWDILDADDLSAPIAATDSVGTDAYAITVTPAPSGYNVNQMFRFKAGTANTGAASITVNGLGAKTIVKVQGGITTALADNDIRVGQIVVVGYDGTNMQMLSQLGNAASGGSGMSPNGVYLSPDSGTTNYIGSPLVQVTLPSAQSWTDRNMTGASAANSTGTRILTLTGASSGLHIQERTVPTAPYTCTVGFVPNGYGQNYGSAGMAVTDGTKVVSYGYNYLYNTYPQLNVSKFSNATSFVATYDGGGGGSPDSRFNLFPGAIVWMQLSDDNTNRIGRFSRDGLSWTVFHTVARADYLTATTIGFFGQAETSQVTHDIRVVHWECH